MNTNSTAVDMERWERALRQQGFSRIAGVDEVGRGAIAGPLVAAAVMLSADFDGTGVRDSKSLSPAQRANAFEQIKRLGEFSVCLIAPEEVMKNGIDECNEAAIRRATSDLHPAPDYVLIDTLQIAGMACPSLGVRHGDSASVTIAAASIIAKVTRDRLMDELHERYPGYGFDRHRGYATQRHFDALVRFGPTPEHRISRRLARKLGI